MDHRQQYQYQTNKLKEQVFKSEMERHELEQQFEQLMRERTKCEKSSIKSLKHRYERFLEEDKLRTSRNKNLLRMLERIDYQAATLAAKTEKLKLLKDQHELYMMRNWNSHRSIMHPAQSQTLPQLQPTASQLNVQISTSSPFTPLSPLASSALPYPSYASTVQPYEHHQQQQSIYQLPPFIPQHKLKDETNLKSDFVKYLSEINQFRDTYDNNGTTDGTRYTSSTYQSADLEGSHHKEISQINFPNEKRFNDVLLYPRNNNQCNASLPSTSYLASSGIPIREEDIDDYKKYLRFQQQEKHQIQQQQQQQQQPQPTFMQKQMHHQLVPNIEISSPLSLDFQHQLYDGSDKSRELTNSGLMTKNNVHHPLLQHNPAYVSDGVSPLNATTVTEANVTLSHHYTNNASNAVNDNLLENNSSGVLQTMDVNNTAVSISNTSANVGAINTNGVIKAIHQPEKENYVSSNFKINEHGSANDNNNILTGNTAAQTSRVHHQIPAMLPSASIDYVNGTVSSLTHEKSEMDIDKNSLNSPDVNIFNANHMQQIALDAAAPTQTTLTTQSNNSIQIRSDMARKIAATDDISAQKTQPTTSGDVSAPANIKQIEDIYGEKIDYPPTELQNQTALLHVVETPQREDYLETTNNIPSEVVEAVGIASAVGGIADNDLAVTYSQGDTTQYAVDQTQQQYQDYGEHGETTMYYASAEGEQQLDATHYDDGGGVGTAEIVEQTENVYPEQSYYDGSVNQDQIYTEAVTGDEHAYYQQAGSADEQLNAQQQQQFTTADYQQPQEYVDQPVDQAYTETNYQEQYQNPANDAIQYNQEQYESYQNGTLATDSTQQQQDFNTSYYSQEPGENYYPDENQTQQQPLPHPSLNESAPNNFEYTYGEPDVVNENNQQPIAAADEYYAAPTDGNAYGTSAVEDESSTTYSENINIQQQQHMQGNGNSEVAQLSQFVPVEAGGPNEYGDAAAVVATIAAPNYLESETDDSTAQQVKGIANDESDFDFSAN